MTIILASQSPRRRELMGLIGVPFTVRTAEAEENLVPWMTPQEQAKRLSRLKAEAVNPQADEIVIGADTIVVAGHTILGKPKGVRHAEKILKALSGKTHKVITGVTVMYQGGSISFAEETLVTFRKLSDKEIADYIATGEPMDKAGAYGIQSGAAKFVQGIRGDYFNVVGLPVCRLSQILTELLEETQ